MVAPKTLPSVCNRFRQRAYPMQALLKVFHGLRNELRTCEELLLIVL